MFIPSDEFMSEKMQPIFDKFGFVTDVYDFVSDMVEAITTDIDEPPTFTVKLSQIEKYGAQDVVIDFSWYAPYKPVGDAVLSGLFILCYAWNCFMHLPNLLQGASNAGHVSSTITKE